jgi:O-antigen/teichoic acid export membrane protein
MSLIRKLAGETAIYGLSSVLGRVVTFVLLTPFLTRVFAPGEYGIVNDLYFYTAFLLVLYTFRFETAVFRFASRAEHDATLVFRTAALYVGGLTAVATLAALWWAPELAAWLEYPDRVSYVVLFLLITAVDAWCAIPYARLRLTQRPYRFALVRLTNITINILLVYAFLDWLPQLAEARGGIWAAVYDPERRGGYVFWANLIAALSSLVFLLPLYWRRTKITPATPATPASPSVWFAPQLWRRMFGYSLPLVIVGLAGIINSLVGIPLLKWYGGGTVGENLALAGIYAAATKLAVLMNLFIQAYNYAAEPFFFRQAAGSQDKTIYADAARAFALIGSLGFVGIMLYFEQLQYFIGEDLRAGLGVLPILLVANFFLGLFYNFAISYKLADKTHLGGWIAVGGSAIVLGLFFLLLPQYGYYAPAWATLACYAFMTVCGYAVSRRYFPIPYRLGRMGYYLVWGLAIYAMSCFLNRWLKATVVAQFILNTGLLVLFLGLLWKTEGPWLRRILGKE